MRLLIALLFFSIIAPALSITTRSFCSVPATDADRTQAVVSASSPTACDVSSDYVSSPLSATYRYDHQVATARSLFTYSTTFNGFSLQPDVALYAFSTPAGTAIATLNFSGTYTTAGELRPGVMIGFFSPTYSHYGGQGSSSFV